MKSKKIIRAGLISTITLLASSSTAYALSCDSDFDGWCLSDGDASFSIVHNAATDEYGMDMVIGTNKQVWVLDFMIDNPALPSHDKVQGTDIFPPHEGTDLYLGDPAVDFTETANTLSINNRAVTGYGTVSYGTIDLDFTLNKNGPDAATLTQTFTFTNTSGATLTDLSFLALTDVTLGRSGQGFYDEGMLTTGTAQNPTGYRQWSNNTGGAEDFTLNASVNVPVDQFEVSIAGNAPQGAFNPCTNGDLCDRAYNDDVLTLSNNVTTAQDDLMMAARWIRTVADGGTFTYTQVFNVAPSMVPVPAAVWLFASGLIGLVGVARRKQSLKA